LSLAPAAGSRFNWRRERHSAKRLHPPPEAAGKAEPLAIQRSWPTTGGID